MQDLLKDIRYAVRVLIRKPAFTLAALLTLALGIGANTAMFSLLDAVLLKPLPFKDPDQLVLVWEKPPNGRFNTVSVGDFLDWRKEQRSFVQLEATRRGGSFNLAGRDQPEKITGAYVTAGYFDLLGVKPALGRTFLPDEDQPNRPLVAVLSHQLWQKQFAGDPALVGSDILVSGQKYTVIGILPANSNFDRDPVQFYAPLVFSDRQNRSSHLLLVYARLQPDVSFAQAQAEMDLIAARLANEYPQTNKGWGVALQPMRERVFKSDLKVKVGILFGSVVLILLIACANLTNLFLARSNERLKEMSIRAAVGATRFRLIRQLLAESLLLAVFGGILGVILGQWIIKVFVALMPAATLPAETTIALDYRVLIFTLAVSVFTGLLFGLVPALQSSRMDLSRSLKEGAATGTLSRQFLKKSLIVCEVALALVLLVGAGLLVRSLYRMQQVEFGFNPQNVLTFHVTLPTDSDQEVANYYTEALTRIKNIPGVETAAIGTDLPIAGWSYGEPYSIPGKPETDWSKRLTAHYQVISPDYFRALEITLTRGRGFTDSDLFVPQPRVIINETLAQRHFSGEDPVGRHILMGDKSSYEIIGVTANVRVYGLGDKFGDANPELYVLYTQAPVSESYFAIRTKDAPMKFAAAVRNELRAVNRDQPIANVRSLEELIDGTAAEERFNTRLLGTFALVALMLAAAGIYGVISHSVAQSTREIGIRVALGAQTRDVLRLIVGQGMVVVGLGVILGLAASFLATRVLRALLYQVSATDLLTFALTPLALLLFGLLACLLPARRATKVEPLIALRHE
jgi:putative ABC transport system permease protein